MTYVYTDEDYDTREPHFNNAREKEAYERANAAPKPIAKLALAAIRAKLEELDAKDGGQRID